MNGCCMLENDLNKVFRACGFNYVDKNLYDDLEKIIAWQNVLREVDVRGVEPMYNTLGNDAKSITNVDNVVKENGDIFANAPEMEDNFFLVPKIIDKK